jgi:hypothetical protein
MSLDWNQLEAYGRGDIDLDSLQTPEPPPNPAKPARKGVAGGRAAAQGRNRAYRERLLDIRQQGIQEREQRYGTLAESREAERQNRLALAQQRRELEQERIRNRNLLQQQRGMTRSQRMQELREQEFLLASSNALAKAGQAITTRVGSLPTPAGIGVLVLILIGLLVFIIPINSNGDTRMRLAFQVLLGLKRVNPNKVATSASQAAGSSLTPDQAAEASTSSQQIRDNNYGEQAIQDVQTAVSNVNQALVQQFGQYFQSGINLPPE